MSNEGFYIWHPKYKEFWEIVGEDEHFLLGRCYIISNYPLTHRWIERREYFEVSRVKKVVSAKTVCRLTRKRLEKEVMGIYVSLGKCSLLSGDQPSLLLED